LTRTPYFDAPYPRRLAHRGLSQHQGGIDENSISAIEAAVAAGATHVESDTHATRDGTAVLFHDDNLERVAGIRSEISALELREIKAIQLLNGSTIPTLSEVFDRFPVLYLNLDIKSEHAIEPTVRAIEAHGAHDRVLVSSFSEARRKKALGMLSKPVATSASMKLVILAWASHTLAFGAGFRSFTKDIDAFQIPVSRGPVKLATRSFIKRAQHANIEVHFWTINDPEQMRKLLELGADGIVTDRVDILTNLKHS
jgi:glycerophosphoryl diester phosphodiesterase